MTLGTLNVAINVLSIERHRHTGYVSGRSSGCPGYDLGFSRTRGTRVYVQTWRENYFGRYGAADATPGWVDAGIQEHESNVRTSRYRLAWFSMRIDELEHQSEHDALCR